MKNQDNLTDAGKRIFEIIPIARHRTFSVRKILL